MSAFVTAGAGFLLAVLWFDLMFDVQVLGHDGGPLPEPVLASIASYYARVTSAARPMNHLIAAVMLATLGAIAAEIAGSEIDAWVAWLSLALAIAPIGLAGARVVPRAVRLGARAEDEQAQSALAHSIFREHVACAALILGLLVLQLAFA
ncbi:MAG TPA: hypothetical protein VII01_07775 [Solirubrobacteraceae bacterium]